MENNNSILNKYYSKYKAGSNVVRFTRAVSKLAPFAKEVLKDVIRELPSNLKDKIRDDIATEILQGNNPLDTLSKSLFDRAYKEALRSGEYSTEDVYNAFKPLGIRKPLYAKVANLNPSIQNIPYIPPRPSFDFSKLKNKVYYTESSDDDEENENKEPMLRGGQSNIYHNKILKYYNKLILKINTIEIN